MKNFKRFLSFTLAFVMLFSTFSFVIEVSAAEGKKEITSYVIRPADCKNAGILRHYYADRTWSDEEIPRSEHDYVSSVITEPTCSAEGVSAKICMYCGERTTSPIPVDESAHKPGKWLVTVEPDEEGNKGLVEQRCELCGELLGSHEVDSLVSGNFAGGNGSREAPYLIYTKEQFNNAGKYDKKNRKTGNHLHKFDAVYFLLINDLDYDGSSNGDGMFYHSFYFDGGNHVIDGISKDGSVFSYDTSVQNHLYVARFCNLYFTDLCVGSSASLLRYYEPIDWFTADNCHVSGTVNGSAGMFALSDLMPSVFEVRSEVEIEILRPYLEGYAGNVINNCSFNGDIENQGGVGGIISQAKFMTISNCSFSGTIKATASAGGIANITERQVTIQDCVNTANITARDSAGGIFAMATTTNADNETLVQGCVNFGSVAACEAGGIIGRTNGSRGLVIISDCYNTGEVETAGKNNGIYYNSAGGLVGDCKNSRITNCYNVGLVKSSDDAENPKVGSIIGWLIPQNSTFMSVFSPEKDRNGNDCSLVGYSLYEIRESDIGTKCVLSELEKPSTFDGFDFESTWTIGEAEGYTYPTLKFASGFEHPDIAVEAAEHTHDFDYETVEIIKPACLNGITEHFCYCGENQIEIIPGDPDDHNIVFSRDKLSWVCERCETVLDECPISEARQLHSEYYIQKAYCDYEFVVGSGAGKLQIINGSTGSTKTYTRDKAVISSLDNGAEKWVISASLAEGSYKVAAKYGKVWNENQKDLRVKYVPVDEVETVISKKGRAKAGIINIVTIASVDKIQLVNQYNNNTMTFTADKASEVGEDGYRSWVIVLKNSTQVSVYQRLRVKYRGVWQDKGYIEYIFGY